MKFSAYNFKYFKLGMNVFDFIILVFSIVDVLIDYLVKSFQIPIFPTVLRTIRLVRFGRILRLFKFARGIRTILDSFNRSIPALLNIGLLLLLIIYIYAIFGMNLFMYVGYSNTDTGITSEFNFETIYGSILTLFPLCTSAGWSVLLDALSNEDPSFCSTEMNNTKTQITKGDCGSAAIAIPYLVSFVIITFFVFMNMYVAVILESFSEAKDLEKGLTSEDFDLFYQVWQYFDPDDTQYIKYEQLSDFLDSLYDGALLALWNSDKKKKNLYESPLRLRKPNKNELIAMNITICENFRLHCEDILDALVNYYLVTKLKLDSDIVKLFNCYLKEKRPDNYIPIGSTLTNIEDLEKIELSNENLLVQRI